MSDPTHEQHDGCGVEEGGCGVDGSLEVFCQPPIAPDPREEPLDDPSPRVNGKADLIGVLAHDFDRDQRGLGDLLAGISAVGKDALDEREHAPRAVETRWIGAELSTIASYELAPYSEEGKSRVRITGPPVLLEPNAAQAIALTLHELATNAAKYGALSRASGQVDLKWSHETDGRLHMRWTEGNGPTVQEPTRKGLGRRVIEQMTAQQKGEARFNWHQEGLVCEITFQV